MIRSITPMGLFKLDRVDDCNLNQVGLTGWRLQEQEGFSSSVGREGQPLYQFFMGLDGVVPADSGSSKPLSRKEWRKVMVLRTVRSVIDCL
jgi:hypothetical protein